MERPATSGGRKPDSFGCFPGGARLSWQLTQLLAKRAREAGEGVYKENLSLWLQMCGARSRDEVRLGSGDKKIFIDAGKVFAERGEV